MSQRKINTGHYDKVEVLDKGYVILRDKMGDDLTPVNAARVSYDKASEELSDRDRRLIAFLAREGHTSPFRHAVAQFELYAPLMVARQWWKYVVGGAHQEGTGDSLDAWNESSRRYITESVEFYVPSADEWRKAPDNSKQGSGEPIITDDGKAFTHMLDYHIKVSEQMYEEALANGICAEQARLFLPAYGLYVRWWWTGSLQSVMHFLAQRLEHDAQKEIQEYAKAVLGLIEPHFNESVKALLAKEVK